MANLIVDGRDQAFVLYELLHMEDLCGTEKYGDFSKDVFDMILTGAEKFAVEEVFPTLAQGDRQGCRIENGSVKVPDSFHKTYRSYCENGWVSMSAPADAGGQGLPAILAVAAREWFMHNFAFTCYPGLGEGAANLVAAFGSEEQKEKYLYKMYTGQWGGTMCLTEPAAGSDVGSIRTRAIRQPDGSYRIQGSKQFITAGDQDLVENIIHPVLARIEGDPPGTAGISIFLVPKFLVNDDGSLGKRNDISIGAIEEKMGLHGSATCLMNFGDNGECRAELLGEERQGLKIMFKLMNEARVGVGLQALSGASTAYLHALQYARERMQGASLRDMKNPDAPRVPIINHPDVRRMLLWMKSHVEGMRALIYYATICEDRARTSIDEAVRERNEGILEVLTPVCKAFCSDMAFRVTELAIQIYGGYGYCAEYPVEQFMRDVKITSIYEGTNGIQALDLIGRKLGMKKGKNFMMLLEEMNGVAERCAAIPALEDLAAELREGVGALGSLAMYFAGCGREGKFMVPVVHAYPFLCAAGQVMLAWLLAWEAEIAQKALEEICADKGIEPGDRKALAALAKESGDAAYYMGKVHTAKYFVRNVLPEAEAASRAVMKGDLSVIEMAEESFRG
ncbi:MAG TPA: acyl-CoA dehydrogenase [Syntrophales bacterium]|nr:acyl-CoA dehydrogenase [Syntrophales bacterium]HQB29872.1 acyl-CoA dehydrogenase [Syntrophales bacterium]HQN78107.1 acyl-CoA dehydrogenase [Syntrophales bacterium]HQQ25929.1 acyl-CoA dehydrogenase [Syntrophales bacterium]